MLGTTYADLMSDGTPFIELQICLEKPPELIALVRALGSVAHQFEHFLRREHPDLSGEVRLFVKEIRQGSTIVELIPQLVLPLIASMDAVLIIDNFVTRFGSAIRGYIDGIRRTDVSRSDIGDFIGTVGLIANDTKGRAIISSAIYNETKTTKRVEFEFSTPEAQKAVESLEAHKHELELSAYEVFKNVLMVFWQSNRRNPKPGKQTGEKAIIERINKRPMSIIYESDLARERIKYETMEDEKNLYKKGFYVDCLVERYNGKPVAYRITAVNDIIDLPDDEEDSSR